MMPREGVTFFQFFWISYVWFGTHVKWRRTRNPARGQAVQSPALLSKFSEELTCCRSKNNFCKKSGACHITGKVETHPDSSEIGRSLRKIPNIPPKVSATKRELICVSHVIYYLWGCCVQLSISRFGSRFTKKPHFDTLKIEKALFVGWKKNRPPCCSLPSQKPHACPIWPCSDKLCHDQG
jgi:hypothetical protein